MLCVTRLVLFSRSVILHAFRPDRFDASHIVASFAGMTTFITPQFWTIVIEIVASIAMPAIAFVVLYRRQSFACTLGLALLVNAKQHR